MLEFTLTAEQAKLLGSLFEALDAKAVKGLDLYSATYLRWDNERLTAFATDRYTLIEAVFDNVVEAGLTEPRDFSISPAQSKALKAAKFPARFEVDGDAISIAVGSVVTNHTMTASEATAGKLRETIAPIMHDAEAAQPNAIAAKVDPARIGRLSKVAEAFTMKATGENKPLVFESERVLALIQPKRS